MLDINREKFKDVYIYTGVRTYHLYYRYEENLTYYCITLRLIEKAIMENHFRIFCVIFVIMVIRNSVLCITEEEIDKIVERRMEKVIRKYDKKIALLEEKIHVKIQNMEKKCSTPDAEEEREKVSFQHTAVNLDNNTHLQEKIVSHLSKRRDNQLRIVQGTVK